MQYDTVQSKHGRHDTVIIQPIMLSEQHYASTSPTYGLASFHYTHRRTRSSNITTVLTQRYKRAQSTLLFQPLPTSINKMQVDRHVYLVYCNVIWSM